MKIEISFEFYELLNEQVAYIAKDKPQAARKFKIDLIKSIKKDLKNPYSYKKSIYFDNENIRDYIFKGYTIVYSIDTESNNVSVFEFIKYMESL
ncbi:type II toxin-antitoxin system RelE/ParE family toxin [Flavobacterium oreochromis]|uniref:Plasmid stabilization protein n=2 Tax=Flavobacterium TaxID=237 RepID=A0A246GAG7_9FLAO|nr:type II toxin-antitoxin system RelE/ParE family toxin [Flavobacterium oreochromis]OWP75707.1 plasmid stabilization protein [Flavobacterium oreochromis]OWP76971.1 plasmid stabilization protein [Flavobacterium oreochromis]QYS86864.1 type II toxin-antitoxin system RelE/ParE family toxin [Flavobacterium oreochromis]